MFASIFQVLIVKPIFNLLVAIYAILPGHNFGLALIIFTVLVRMLMWPLVKKQLKQTKAMRKLQPELKKIKEATKGNRQKESQMQLELYKEKGINPLGSVGTLIIQLIILLGLYSGLRSVIASPKAILTNSYSWLHKLSWMQQLGHNIHLFDSTLLGFVNLSKSALETHGGIYWPAMIIVLASAITQFYSSKQLLPSSPDARGLRQILREAGKGSKADQSEVNAAVTRTTKYFIPVMVFLFTVSFASALSLYWFIGGLTAFLQQGYILRKDEEEMEVIADAPDKKTNRVVIENEVIKSAAPRTVTPNKKTKKKPSKNKRRRK